MGAGNAATTSGWRDWRLLPGAVVMWIVCAALPHLYQTVRSSVGSQAAVVMAAAVVVGLFMVTSGALVAVVFVPTGKHVRHQHQTLLATVCVGCGAGVVGSAATLAACLTLWNDSAYVWAQNDGGHATVVAQITTPALRSRLRGYDCQTDARILELTARSHTNGSHALTRVYMTGSGCDQLRRGSRVRVNGEVTMAQFGTIPLWVQASNGASVSVVADANPVLGAIDSMQRDFFEVTDQLDEQGSVLVPGLTIGILGQDRIIPKVDADNEAYTTQLEFWFTRAGIMHLMAVSGGHFILLASGIKRLCALVRMPRRVTAVVLMVMLSLLALLVYPAASVGRAWMMGMFLGWCFWRGRPMQTLSSLCWTVILTLALDPGMALNMGFALSCGAVMAIAMFATPMALALSHMLPNAVAKSTAVTIAAQMGTLPLQILMEPQLPLWSIPANLLVAPFVNAATILGLIALLVAPVCEPVAFSLAWLAGCATGVVERVAYHLGADPQTCLPWASGTVGALLIAVVEAAGILAVYSLYDLRSHKTERAGIGTTFHRSPIQTARVWWTETVRMVTDAHFDDHGSIDVHSGFDVHS